MSLLTDAVLDPAEVMRYRQHYDRLWNDARTKFNTADLYYRRRHAIWPTTELSDARSNHYPSTPTAIIDHAVDQQTVLVPKVHCYPAGESETHKKRATLKEKFLTAVLNDAAVKEPSLVWKALAKYLNLYGYGILEGPTFTLDGMPPEPINGDGEDEATFKARHLAWERNRNNFNPFRIQAPNPAWVLLDPWTMQPKFAFKTYDVESSELADWVRKKKWQQEIGAKKTVYSDPVVPGRKDDEPLTVLTVTEVWAAYWHEVYQGATRLFSEVNVGGFVPFSHGYSGGGMEYSNVGDSFSTSTSMAGGNMATSLFRRNPADLCVGILEPIYDVLKMHAQQVNAKNNAVVESGYVQLMTAQDAAGLAAQRKAGAIGEFDKDQVWWLAHPGLAPFVMEVDRENLEDIERGTFNLQAAGFSQPNVDTATQQIILTNAADKKFLTINKQISRMATEVGGRILRLVEALGMTLTVQGVTISPEDIDGLYDCEITFESIDPVVESQRKMVAQNEVKMGLKSPQTYYEEFGGEDWEGEQDRMMEQDLRKTPLMQTVKMAAIARKLGEIEIANELDAKAKQLRQQMLLAIQQGPGGLTALSEGAPPVPPQPGGMPAQRPLVPQAPPQNVNGQAVLTPGMMGGMPGG